ncbi:MAG: peptidoglycan DD-metalloendopeptidase family protein [Cyanobacteria bacterium P01_H01_bin.74]
MGLFINQFGLASVFKVFLALSVALILIISNQSAHKAYAADKQKLEALQSKTKKIKNKAALLRRKKYEKMRAAKKMSQTIYYKKKQLNRKKSSLRQYQTQLSQTRQTLSSLDAKLDKTLGDTVRYQAQASERLRALYMGQRLSLLQMILEASDLSVLLDRLYYKKKMVNDDKALLISLEEKVEELNRLKGELARQRVLIGQTVSGIKVKNMQIERSIAVDTALKKKYQNDAAFYAKAEAQLLRESKSITSQIQSLMRKNNKTFSTVKKSTGRFMWPIRGRITSGFGTRFHPIRKRRITHTGIDIAGPNRGAVKASDGGTVIFSGWKGGYGNAVMINHGNRNGKNYVTLYGHLAVRKVSKGKTVSKGQVIGLEGSTGYSTGPHLHFEIRVNGVPVNPKPYL